MTSPMRTLAAVRTFISVIAVCVSAIGPIVGGAELERDRESAQAAMKWALDNRREAFDRLLPAASEENRDSGTQTAISIRQEGFEDRFEFALRIDALQSGATRAVLTIPDREPLSVQLARIRLDAPTITLTEALSHVHLRRVTLPNAVAKRLLQGFLATTIPARPQTGIFLHRPTFEVTILAWSELRVIVTDDGDQRSRFRSLLTAIRHALSAAQLSDGQLRFDPRVYYGSEPQ
jgi:hypothetical protein